MLMAPAISQGVARFRRGRAVVQFEYTVADTYAERFEAELLQIMAQFETKLAPFDLTLPSAGH